MPTSILWFRRDLRLGDHPALLAAREAAGSNNHGWQWVAGTGTDAAPFYRVFDPVTQGKKFDPDGEYATRWVPELRGLDARHVHEPWTAPGGIPAGYPAPVVDHAHERRIALERYERARAGA
jgi:deoxyribodipyrimidine photo-lyase